MLDVRGAVAELRVTHGCEVRPPTGRPSVVRVGEVLIPELETFYDECGGADLFPDAAYGITLLPPEEFVPVNPLIIGEEVEDDITAHWYAFGRTADRDYISVDSERSRAGRFYDSSQEGHGVAGSCEIVATGLTQLLNELLRAQGGHWYWLRPGWPTIGDAYEGVVD